MTDTALSLKSEQIYDQNNQHRKVFYPQDLLFNLTEKKFN